MSAELEITVLEERLRLAVLAGDTVELGVLLADDLVFIDQAGRFLSKQYDLTLHESGDLRVTRMDVVSRDVRLLDNAAVVNAQFSLAGTYQGADFENEFAYTRVWQKLADGWKVVSAHCSGPIVVKERCAV